MVFSFPNQLMAILKAVVTPTISVVRVSPAATLNAVVFRSKKRDNTQTTTLDTTPLISLRFVRQPEGGKHHPRKANAEFLKGGTPCD
jgi:hypothetical protein